LPKCPTGIQGLDEITDGRSARGAAPRWCVAARAVGKRLLAAEFLVRGASQFGEPGVFMAFEGDREAELKANVASLGFDLAGLIRRKKIVVDYVHIERSEIQESGEYVDLEGLFVRAQSRDRSVGAKRVCWTRWKRCRSACQRGRPARRVAPALRWLKEKGVTAVITANAGAIN